VALHIEQAATAEVEATVRDVVAVMQRHGAIQVRTARSEAERKMLWAGRKGAFGAMGRVAPDLYVADVVVPRNRLREVVARTTEIARERRLKLATVFHAGDGNLHPNICYDRRDPEEVARVVAAGHEIMELCLSVGGSLTGEHGVGLEKMGMMERLFGEADHADYAAVGEPGESCRSDRRLRMGALPRRRGLQSG